MDNNIQYPTQFSIGDITIEGKSVIGLFESIEIFENIGLAGVTGTITLIDTDGAEGEESFFEANDIQFCEPIEFNFTNALDQTLTFEGRLNNLKSEVYVTPRRIYTIDFVSVAVHKNEMKFVNKKYNNQTPNNIIIDMVELLNGSVTTKTDGDNMTFLGCNRKPYQIVKYVINHAVTPDAEVTNDEENPEQKASGGSGFLFWETVDGFRFCPTEELLKEDTGAFTEWPGFITTLSNTNDPVEDTMKHIMESEFPKISDYHSKLRSGQLKCKHVSFDTNTGQYRVVNYDGDKVSSQKLIDACEEATRVVYTTKNNEKHSSECTRTKEGEDDQSENYLTQTIAKQNSFNHSIGRLTLAPQFEMRAGDVIEIAINKTNSKDCIGKQDEKKSGKYVLKQVSHHIFSKGDAYTKVTIVRNEKDFEKKSKTTV